MKIDFEAEGLLDGVEGEARASRLELLERLAGEGVPLEELRDAVEGGRLTLLPVERALSGDGPRYTPREVAEKVGLELEKLQRISAALGVPYPDPDERSVSEADLEAWYEANSARFMDPETVALEYLEFKPDASGAAIEVTEEALRELYEQQADLHRSQEQRLARHILIPVEGEDVAAAEAKATALVARLTAGEDFASSARAESQDPGSAADGDSRQLSNCGPAA